MKHRIWPFAVLLACTVGAPLVAGCDKQPEITKDSFKPPAMPPDAVKGREESMKKLQAPPPTGH